VKLRTLNRGLVALTVAAAVVLAAVLLSPAGR
jgi:hypothetical protein